jgi:nuclear mRNA export protein PCID2/THP1
LGLFVTAVEWQKIPMDIDEMESILANLIYEGYIKGYLSHQAGMLVVSSSNAFPPLPIKE